MKNKFVYEAPKSEIVKLSIENLMQTVSTGPGDQEATSRGSKGNWDSEE